MIVPARFCGHFGPLDTSVEPTESFDHLSAGPVALWIVRAMASEPSAGTIGRMELLRHWDRLPASERKALLFVARSMAIQEQLEDPQP